MRKLDEVEKKVITELIRNPRISDNAVAKKLKIPTMTVNRKRKRLEKEGLLNYYVDVNRCEGGYCRARQLFLIKFKSGLTKREYIDSIKKDPRFGALNSRYFVNSYIGEKDGHLASVIILEAESDAEVTDIFQGKVIPVIKKRHGKDCIEEITTCKLTFPLRVHRNYLPNINMNEGKISSSWPDEFIFVQE